MSGAGAPSGDPTPGVSTRRRRAASAATGSAGRPPSAAGAAGVPAPAATAGTAGGSRRRGRSASTAGRRTPTGARSSGGGGGEPPASVADAPARTAGGGGTQVTPFRPPSSRLRGSLGNVSAMRRRSASAAIDSADLPTASAGGAGGAAAGAAADAGGGEGGAGADAAHTFVWGTAIDIASIAARLRRFLQQFEVPGSGVKKYVNLLQQMHEDGETVLNVDAADVLAFDPTLYAQLVKYPSEVITLMDEEARTLVAELAAAAASDGPAAAPPLDPADVVLSTKPFNLADVRAIRDLNPSDINQLVSVRGMLTRCSAVIPDMRVAAFRCEVCGAEEHAFNDRGRVEEPAACAACGARWAMRLLHNRSGFFDKQIVKMQESPDAIPPGEAPHSVTMLAFDDAVDAAQPGDRVTVTGIYKAAPIRVNPRMSSLRAVYKTHLDIVHVGPDAAAAEGGGAGAGGATAPPGSAGHARAADASREAAAARAAELRALAADPAIYDRLAASLAPSIWQLDDVKKGVLAQLFGGVAKTYSGGRSRGEINVMLVGDPGVSKSQILSYVHKLAPRGLYTSGRGSSAVGLTAYVAKDPETREMVLESGALVLSDRGICCIDEFDKMSDGARAMLHEVMEQQTVSVAKAGIVASLNARTSVLAAANPVGSRYNPRLSVVDNIGLPPSLVSRFDLIYLLLDKADEGSDRKLARHLIGLYHPEDGGGGGLGRAATALLGGVPYEPIPTALLRDYIAFAREHCHPALSPEAASGLAAAYVDMRRLGDARSTITATPRQLESLVRLAEARARARLARVVTAGDVEEAVRLMRVALQQSATDPVTGAIDMDLIQTGVSAAARALAARLAPTLRAALAGAGAGGLGVPELVAAANAAGAVGFAVGAAQVREALRALGEDVVVMGDAARLRGAE